MELGYTLPLQRRLGMRGAPRGGESDLRLCWDLHLLRPGGRDSLFAVHASSRFALLLYDLSGAQWAALPEVFREELARCLAEEDMPPAGVARMLGREDCPRVTGTHGRRPVAFLNRAVDDLYALAAGLDPERLEQPLVRRFLNDLPRRAAGHETPAPPRELLRRDLQLAAAGLPQAGMGGIQSPP